MGGYDRMWEDVVDVDKILTAFNMEGRLYTRNQLSGWSVNGPIPCLLMVIQGN